MLRDSETRRVRCHPANYVTRDTAPGLNKRGSVCASSSGPGGAHRAGRGSGRASGRARGFRRTARVPRPTVTAARPLPPPSPPPRAGELRPESPRAATADRPGSLGSRACVRTRLAAAFQLGTPPSFPPRGSPDGRARRGGEGEKSDHSRAAARVGAARVAWRAARPLSLCPRGGGVARRVTAARMTPSRWALAAGPRSSPPTGVEVPTGAPGLTDPGSRRILPPLLARGATQSFGKLRPYLAW